MQHSSRSGGEGELSDREGTLFASSGVRFLQNLVSARPSSRRASPRASSALRIQRRRTKPLRGGPISSSPMGIEWPDPMPRQSPGGSLARPRTPRRRCVDVARPAARAEAKGVPVPPREGGRSRIRMGHHGNRHPDSNPSDSIMSYPTSGTVPGPLWSPPPWAVAGIPRPRPSGRSHIGDRPGSASPPLRGLAA